MTTLIPKFDLKNGTATPDGAINRPINEKIEEIVSVKDFGAKGDGTTDDTTAFINALAASTSVYVPVGIYKITDALEIPVDTKLYGTNRQATTLTHAFNGDMINMLAGASLVGLTINGDGANYTGQGVTCLEDNGRQVIQDCTIYNFAAACIYFESLAGSQSVTSNVIAYQLNGTSGSDKYAIVIQDTGSQVVGAVPRVFTQIESAGFCSFFFGSTNDVFVTSSFIADLKYTINSIGVFISNCRIANQTALTVNGAVHVISGCDIAPQITLGDTVGGLKANTLTITGNTYNSPPIIDNFGVANIIEQSPQAYTCTLTSSGTAPVLGNGTIAAVYTRLGGSTYVSISFTMGSTTNLGSGELIFSLPYKARDTEHNGVVKMRIGTTYYSGMCYTSYGLTTLVLVRDTTGAITYNSPGSFTTGDIINIALTYN